MAKLRMDDLLRVRIPKPLRRRVKDIAKHESGKGLPVYESDLIREAVRDWVERREKAA